MTDISGQLRLRLEQLVDEYVTSGAKALEVIAALEKELAGVSFSHKTIWKN
ncbi:hypothetical protein ACDY96_21660 [Rhizobium mongolense]|uniref:hypothetical protein n=1 Tax=Rhizobium mongolense TaxID=57676 RepID=UPI003558D792